MNKLSHTRQSLRRIQAETESLSYLDHLEKMIEFRQHILEMVSRKDDAVAYQQARQALEDAINAYDKEAKRERGDSGEYTNRTKKVAR